MRLDLFLVEKNYFKSRHQAQIEIKNNRIKVNKDIITKPSFQVSESDDITVLTPYNPYVSMGGLKLEKALTAFGIDCKDTVVCDVGASTGGFTDCVLKRGAKHVKTVDVDHHQIDATLAAHPQTTITEGLNFLDTDDGFFKAIDFIVMDVSFTSSLPLIFHAYKHTHVPLIALIKPQFETMDTPSSGVIKNKKQHLKILKNYQNTLNQHNIYIQALTYSPIKGKRGNIEFLCLISKKKNMVDLDSIVDEAHKALK